MKTFLREMANPTSEKSRKRSTVLLVLLWTLVAVLGGLTFAQANGKTTTTAWVMCRPGDWVNVRGWAKAKGESYGMLETGYSVELDGQFENGFAHCVDMALETDEGWVSTGYLVFEKPEWMDGAWYRVEADGRVAARKNVSGERLCWLKPGTELQIFWMADEWAVTTRGFIRSEYLAPVDQ